MIQRESIRGQQVLRSLYMFTIELFSLLICIQSETPERQQRKACGSDLRLYVCRIYLPKLLDISANDAEPDQTAPKGAAQHGPTTFDRNGNDNTADAKVRRLKCVRRPKG